MLAGRHSLEDITAWVLESDLNPQPTSGKQEWLENTVNRYV
jgi:xylose isomerase